MLRELNTNEMEMVSGGHDIGGVTTPTGGIELWHVDASPTLLFDVTPQAFERNPMLKHVSGINQIETILYVRHMYEEHGATPTEGESAMDILQDNACNTPPGVYGAAAGLGCMAATRGAGGPNCMIIAGVSTITAHVIQTEVCDD